MLHLKVEESLTGQSRVGDELRVASGPGSCGIPVRVGASYLIDAGSYQGQLATGFCSESGDLQQKRTQTFIRRLRVRNSGGRGDDLQVELAPRAGGGAETPPEFSLADVDVTLTPVGNGKALHWKTDPDGVLTLPIVSAGKYVFTTDLPKGLAIDQMFGQTWMGKPATIEIPAGQGGGAACQYVMFVRPSGSISGEVVDATGKRMAQGVPLIFASTSSRSSADPVMQEDGSFIARFVAPGTYYLKFFVGNDWKRPWFYPGVRSEAEAKAIVVGEGEQVEGIRVVLPRSDGPTPANPGER
jgi:hypothetical protein